MMLSTLQTYANFPRCFESPVDPQPARHGCNGADVSQDSGFIPGRIYHVGIASLIGAVFRPNPGYFVEARGKAKQEDVMDQQAVDPAGEISVFHICTTRNRDALR
jgi:hypothetical protein